VYPILLKTLVPTMGENGSALAISTTQRVMVGLLFLYLRFKPTEKTETWPGLSRDVISKALQPQPLLDFISLSLGGVLSLSKWWLRETVCFIVGTFGVLPIVVRSIAYNLAPLLFMPILGVQIRLTIRMGQIIEGEVIGNVVYNLYGRFWSYPIYLLVHLPDQDYYDLYGYEEVLEGCKEIWASLSYYIFIPHFFGVNCATLRVLGMQWRMAMIIFGFLWFIVLLSIIYFAVRRG
jgi:hypothetical protein